jgi:hypothetical protein
MATPLLLQDGVFRADRHPRGAHLLGGEGLEVEGVALIGAADLKQDDTGAGGAAAAGGAASERRARA